MTAGDVIGYLGRTGYSTTENTNNITTPHLHFGIQLIFDESQKEGNNEIWIDCYEIVKFLRLNQSETVKVEGTKEWTRVYGMKDPDVPGEEENSEAPSCRKDREGRGSKGCSGSDPGALGEAGGAAESGIRREKRSGSFFWFK